MYPQATAASESSTAAPPAIPVGFGIPDQYQRRLGPEGEEMADLIGPDGHTEQLPPYTRYPDESYARKVRAAEGIGATIETRPTQGVPQLAIAPIPGAGGLGLATRDPEFESVRDDLSSPQSRHSLRSFTTDSSSHEINTAAAVVLNEKEKPKKKLQRWGAKRLWGVIPYWAICLTVGSLIIMGIILGSVIGVFVARQKRKPPHRDDDS
jgi:hypothetical protein